MFCRGPKWSGLSGLRPKPQPGLPEYATILVLNQVVRGINAPPRKWCRELRTLGEMVAHWGDDAHTRGSRPLLMKFGND